MALYFHTEVKSDWHIVRSGGGVFFGHSREEATQKAKAYQARKAMEKNARLLRHRDNRRRHITQTKPQRPNLRIVQC